jgi:signal transduction histidine kinase
MTGLSATGYAFLGLTVIVAMLVAIVMFAVLRFTAAARETRRNLGDSRVESVLLASALEEAIGKLKAQERATAERAEASEQLSSEIVSSLTSGLIVADREGAVQIVNPAARRILKLRDQTQVSDAVWEEVPELREVILESLHTQAPILRRTLALNRPEGTMHLGVTVSPLGAGSTTRGAICLFTDLTSVMALEERLRLKEALAQLGELTAGLAHEFRNGLATIHGYGWLLDPSVLPPQQRPYVEGIREETHALGEVVTNFLRFARPEPLALAPVDLRSLVESAAEDAPSARFTISGDLGRVDADEVLLRQALSNLFRNSVEACAAVNRATEIGVEGRLDPVDNTVTLTVTDNGPGIQPEAMSRLFQPFFTTRPNGSGLGLAIVQKVVVSHNGRVSAANRADGGAAFQLTLPLAAA